MQKVKGSVQDEDDVFPLYLAGITFSLTRLLNQCVHYMKAEVKSLLLHQLMNLGNGSDHFNITSL